MDLLQLPERQLLGVRGRDIAQTIQADGGSLIVFQWNEPFDPQPPTVVGVIAEDGHDDRLDGPRCDC